jgi:hypothetical protein
MKRARDTGEPQHPEAALPVLVLQWERGLRTCPYCDHPMPAARKAAVPSAFPTPDDAPGMNNPPPPDPTP